MKKTTILVIIVLFMIIGYAAYNTTINIYGNGKLAENLSDFKVYLSNLKVNGKEVNGINNTKDEFTINDINGDISVDVINDSTEYDTEASLECSTNNTWDFDYIESEQTLTIPITGIYKLETWGAQGGYGSAGGYSNDKPGYGGYSVGTVNLETNSKLYISVGGFGGIVNTITGSLGGYNGGGNGESTCGGFPYPGGGGGGGATHIATKSGLLSTLEDSKSSILIVSGGGGGAGLYNGGYNQQGGYAGSGGGFEGNPATTTNLRIINGGTQSSGYSFGQGNTSTSCHIDTDSNWGNGGGGGGFYGGNVSEYFQGKYTNAGGSGGSGYIGNAFLSNKIMYCYNCAESPEVSTKTISTTCVSENPKENCAKQGNGYARVTLVDSTNNFATDKNIVEALSVSTQKMENIKTKSLTCKLKVNKISRTEKKTYNGPTEWTFNYTGGEQTFTAPITGTYKLEVWGAQGGNYDTVKVGGYGGYSVGEIKLDVKNTLYINIGGKGTGDGIHTPQTGGYNGGGNANSDSDGHTRQSSGGGATHVSFSSGLLKELHTYTKNDIIIVSGGGAGSAANSEIMSVTGGSAGGYKGNNGEKYQESENLYGTGYGGNQNESPLPEYGSALVKPYYSIGGAGYGADGIYAGGGGGYFGGSTSVASAGGGSSYIGNTLLTNKAMYCYNCTESNEESIKTVSTTCTSATPTAKCSKQGNGYARITLISY